MLSIILQCIIARLAAIAAPCVADLAAFPSIAANDPLVRVYVITE